MTDPVLLAWPFTVRIGLDGPFVLLAHLRRGSPVVQVSQTVRVGDPVAQGGNSGNSTEPHVHVQVSDRLDWADARGVPLAFVGRDGSVRLPRNGEIVGA